MELNDLIDSLTDHSATTTRLKKEEDTIDRDGLLFPEIHAATAACRLNPQ